MLYRIVFRRQPDTLSVSSRTVLQDSNKFAGKIISHIEIEVIDPSGRKNPAENKWYDRLANRVHYDTRKSTVRKYLFFTEGEEYNPQKVYEFERILRSTDFVNRVNISVSENKDAENSVNIHIKVLDSWSLKPRFSFSGRRFGVGAAEENLFGLGHEVDFRYINNFKDKQNQYFASYTANNLFGTFVNARILGEKDFLDNELVNFTASRDFFSPLTRWAGGLTFEYFKRIVALPRHDATINSEEQIKVYKQDLWAGYQFPVFVTGNNVSRNIAVLGRFQNYQYKDSPVHDDGFFQSSSSVLASAVFTDRKFSVQRNIFRYNLPEDIPYGKAFGVTGGALMKGNETIPYAGMSASFGEFTDWGYFDAKVQYGHFFGKEGDKKDEFRVDGTYFTNLQDWKFAKVRHFLSPTFALGNWQYQYSYKDRMNLLSRDEFPIYNGDFIGSKKLILRYQMQMFVNKTWKNFHFIPYITTAVGWLSQNQTNIFKSQANAKVGLGLLLYNPYLVFSRIQVSLMYYPKVPFDTGSVFEFNGYRNDMFPQRTFATEVPQFVNFNN